MSTKRPTYKITDWHRLYREGWQGEIVPDAFTHPAKYARALIRNIYQHARAEGWAPAGSRVLDPFGGVGLGALDAMRLGLHWTGVELEPRFAGLGYLNIALWNARYAEHFAQWGTARLLCGDSRNLAALVGAAPLGLLVSSPPYAESLNDNHYGDGIDWSKAERTSQNGGRHQQPGKSLSSDYGSTAGNLGKMLAGNFDLAVSSPPFGEQNKGGGLADPNAEFVGNKPGRNHGYQNQAAQPGNLAGMPMTPFDLAVSSPPYADGARQEGNDLHPERMEGTAHTPARYDLAVSSPPYEASLTQGNDREKYGQTQLARDGGGQLRHPFQYGDTAGQLGKAVGDDFWSAARVIVEQTYAVLAPGAHACWVVKDFVRNKQRVPFADQWRQLCEAVGFRTLHLHHAWVVEHRGTQYDLAGQPVTNTVERKSFFRRLAEKKGSPRIDWETVLCMEKVS